MYGSNLYFLARLIRKYLADEILGGAPTVLIHMDPKTIHLGRGAKSVSYKAEFRINKFYDIWKPFKDIHV